MSYMPFSAMHAVRLCIWETNRSQRYAGDRSGDTKTEERYLQTRTRRAHDEMLHTVKPDRLNDKT